MIFTPYGNPKGDPYAGPEYLAPTQFIDSDHETVRDFSARAVGDATDDTEKAIRIFNAVRDQILYDMFTIRLEPERFRASETLQCGAGWCVPKAVVLAACARAAGIPAAIGLSDVVNHFTTPKVQAAMGESNVFIHHGYAVLYVGGRWLKAVPAFNASLCAKIGVATTDFDGTQDAILQEYDANNNVRMEYLKHHGMWSDLPFDRVVTDFRDYYPQALFELGT